MKQNHILQYSVLLILLTQSFQLNAQAFNWKWAEKTNHIIQTNFGIDQGFVSGVGYLRRISTKKPVFLNLHVSTPAGENNLDDLKVQLGGQILLLNQSKFKGSIGLQGIARRYENKLVRIYNFGSKLNGNIGYYSTKWFAAFNTGFDKAIVSNYKHSTYFRQHYYRQVKDGWYEPTMGGNLYLSLQTGFTLNNFELTIELGRIWNEDFLSSPTLPISGILGLNYRFPRSIKNSKQE
jgi:hypothetical protein